MSYNYRIEMSYKVLFSDRLDNFISLTSMKPSMTRIERLLYLSHNYDSYLKKKVAQLTSLNN